jgi:hypothetical protein
MWYKHATFDSTSPPSRHHLTHPLSHPSTRSPTIYPHPLLPIRSFTPHTARLPHPLSRTAPPLPPYRLPHTPSPIPPPLVQDFNRTYAAPAAPIDWASYKASLASSEGVVGAFESAHNALSVDAYTNDLKGEAEAEFAKIIKEAADSVAASEARMAEIDAEIVVKTAAMTTKDTTVEDIYAAFPEMEAEVEEEIKNEQWNYTQ